MSELGYHLIMRRTDDGVIAATSKLRRELSRVVYRVGGAYSLLAFRCVDTHLHVELMSTYEQALRFSRALGNSVRRCLKLSTALVRSRLKEIKNQWHLYDCFKYILNQERHHGICVDEFHEASVLPELLGLRFGGAGVVERVRAYLPRVNRSLLEGYLGGAFFECTDF